MNYPYSETVLERFKSPHHAGKIKDLDGVGEAGDPSCGDMTRIYIKVKDDIITDARFKVIGCAAAIASSDMACDLIIGKTIEEALKVTNEEVIKKLGGLPEEKEHCSVMAEEAIVRAVDDFRSRQGIYFDHLSYYSSVPCRECNCGMDSR
ncbi:MAG: iron-sulfur cluster assembly scaffold protein [Candidatus Eremiobacteraeota bacterium]|nr:iron-sulfur cluster assembly scaffold protein [Candidatus Eremiobacteraeota bacterium]